VPPRRAVSLLKVLVLTSSCVFGACCCRTPTLSATVAWICCP
jgi:hypothetical protein